MKTKTFLFLHHFSNHASTYGGAIAIITILIFSLIFSNLALAKEIAEGEQLFLNHCVGCHINGGNIIRRGRNLKLSTLERNGLDNKESIAKIARDGIGQMSGYAKELGLDGDNLVAEWILEQAKQSWP